METPSSTLFVTVFIAAIPYLVNYLINVQELSDQANTLSKSAYVENKIEVFDFIIVGLGSAGSVVANRLSKEFNVLAIEAGGFPVTEILTGVPLLHAPLQHTKMDYNYETTVQKNTYLAFTTQTVRIPRGKVVGGSSCINNMMYVRGHARDYDIWVNATGNQIWSSKSVLKYFKKSEDYHGNYPLGTTHSTGGELYVGKQVYTSPLQGYLTEALKETNIATGDVNAKPGEVFGYPDVHIKNGERWSAYKAFIQPILHRDALTIYPFSFASKIHFNILNRAVGVTYHRHGVSHFVRARYEVIVCTGVFESPKLLMLSGIGPGKDLEAVGIPCLIDLPVGKYLNSHSYIPVLVTIDKNISFVPSRDLNAYNYMQYYAMKQGPLATSDVRFGIGFAYTKKEPAPKAPGIYFVFNGIGGGAANSHDLIRRSRMEFKTDIYGSYYEPLIMQDGFFVEVACVRPKSTGEVRLRSRHWQDKPVIDPKTFTDPFDVDCTVDGFVFLKKLIESSSAFKSINAKFLEKPFPGCENTVYKSRDYWACYVRQVTGSPDAAASTCPMGPDAPLQSSTAVLDSRLRVLHTSRLRVIDSSIMPLITTGNPLASTYMIGEVGAQMVLRRWRKRRRNQSKK